MNPSKLLTYFLLAVLSYMLVISFTNETPAISVPAQQYPISDFESAKNPLYKYGLVKKASQKSKIYKSIIPLRADGRLEIPGGELDWRYYSFNGEVDISGQGVDGIAGDVELPDDFPADAAKLTVKYFDNLKTGCYALYDLNANGIDEIIVQSGSGSSGYQYAFLEKQKGEWRVINGFAGSFILTSLDPLGEEKKSFSRDYWYITHWWTSGRDFIQITDVYKGGEYKAAGLLNIPFAIRELDFGKLNIDGNC